MASVPLQFRLLGGYPHHPATNLLFNPVFLGSEGTLHSFHRFPLTFNQGLIISLTVLFAAGLAVYENPQVRQWVDSSRRKIATALHSLGDEITPPSASRDSSLDASTREDESPEGVERRRRARQEILERGRAMEEKRKTKGQSARSHSFDDMVDTNGILLNERQVAATTAAEVDSSDSGLRNRHTESNDAVLDTPLALPTVDEAHIRVHDSSPTAPAPSTSPQPLLIDTEAVSNHPSEALLDLTPTTSTSSAAAQIDFSPPRTPTRPYQNHWSVHEWAENHTVPAFYSPLQSEHAAALETNGEPWGALTPASGEHLSRVGSEVGLDVWSEAGERVSTPGSWTEVGSVVSEDY